jgi:hypothetical protein
MPLQAMVHFFMEAWDPYDRPDAVLTGDPPP